MEMGEEHKAYLEGGHEGHVVLRVGGYASERGCEWEVSARDYGYAAAVVRGGILRTFHRGSANK
jgi:hypothetical protein